MYRTYAQTAPLILKRIARRVLLEKGLLPEFSKEAEEELAALNAPATADKAQIRVQFLRTDVDRGFIDFKKVSSGRERKR